MPVMARAQEVGVAASGAAPIYRTSTLLNVGTEQDPLGLGLDVMSIPASRTAHGISRASVASAIQADGGGPEFFTSRRMVGIEAPTLALAWTITSAAAQLHHRDDIGVDPSDIDDYSAEWARLSPLLEDQIVDAIAAPLFVIENSPPVFQTASNWAGGTLATVSYASGHMSAATLLVVGGAIFVINAIPAPARALGDYVSDLIRRLPGSRQ